MAQRTRARRWGAATLVAMLCVHAEAQAQPVEPGKQASKSVRSAARDPEGSARSLATLARFANGQLGDSPYDRRVAAALARLGNARAIAKRIVGPYEALGEAERAQVFAGVAGLDKLTTRVHERVGASKREAAKPQAASKTVLAPDIARGKGNYGLLYRGMTVHKGADADGTDEPVVYTAVFWPGPAEEPYRSTVRTLPETGTLGVANGASSGASAGEVWSSSWWPSGTHSGVVLLSAVIEDNGDLAQRKEELGLLIAFARSQAAEDGDPDRMAVLRRELEDALELLHLADHQYWDSRAIQVRLIGGADYDKLTADAAVASPFPHRLTMSHNPRGGDYTLYFDVPTPQVTYRTVSVTVRQIEALGPDRDRRQNGLADFSVDAAMHGNTPAATSWIAPANKNLLKSPWTVERRFQAGSNVLIQLSLYDQDPPSELYCLDPHCARYCGDKPAADRTGAYTGLCAPQRYKYDINELPDVYNGSDDLAATRVDVTAVYDLGSNTLSGDIDGPAGTYTLTGTPGGDQARVVVEISQK